jgi:hypothetical protein
VPARLTPEPAKHEARKRRANERHAVGCSEELCRGPRSDSNAKVLPVKKQGYDATYSCSASQPLEKAEPSAERAGASVPGLIIDAAR